MLQAFTGEGRTPSGCTDNKALRQLIASSPELITRALEPEHRIEDVEGNHRQVVSGVGGADHLECCRTTGLGNTGVQNLTLLGLAVGQHHVCVNRSVGLTRRVEDLRRGEDGIQTEGACLIRNDWNEVLADVLVLDEVLDQAHQSHSGGNFELAGSLRKGLERLRGKLRKLRLVIAALGNPTAQLLTQFLHVQQSRVICRRHVIGRHVGIAFQLFIGNGKLQTIAKKLRVFDGELLHLVRRVTTGEVATQRIAFNSVSQDNGRLTGVLGCSLVCGVHLSVVVTAALQGPDLIVGPVLNHCLGPRIAAKEVLTNVRTIICTEGLVVTIQSFVHQVNKRVILI